MKKIVILSCVLFQVYFATAQNTFPANGNVGIGTTSPASKLHVDGSITLQMPGNTEAAEEGITPAPNHRFNYDGKFLNHYGFGFYPYTKSVDVGGVNTYISGYYGLDLFTAAQNRMRIDLYGNVGIGTKTPDKLLTLKADSFIGWKYTDDSSASYHTITGGGINPISFTVGPFSDPTLPIFKFNGFTGTKVSILNGGNVGIGTTTPTEKLEVSGNTKINGNLTFSNYGGGFYMVEPSWIRTFGGKSFYHDAGLMRTDGTFQVGPDGDRFVVNQSGNVGIGTSNPTAKLHVAGTIIGQDFISNGINSFIFHTPDDGRKSLHIAPYENGNWNWVKQFTLSDGNVAVQGKLEAKEIKVTTTPKADFVFANNYILPTLASVEKHIKEKKHLPEIASASEMERDGVNVGEFQIKLLQKIEELTLYIIDLKKEINTVKTEIKILKNCK